MKTSQGWHCVTRKVIWGSTYAIWVETLEGQLRKAWSGFLAVMCPVGLLAVMLDWDGWEDRDERLITNAERNSLFDMEVSR